MDKKEMISCVMVIFGGTGDLTHRKLMPALYNLEKSGLLPDNFSVISVGRRKKTSDSYIEEIYHSVKSYIFQKIDEQVWDKFKKRISYHMQDFAAADGYTELKNRISKLSDSCNVLFYLAVSPQLFEPIIDKLKDCGLANKENAWRRVVIEKPFGRDLETAEYLNDKISEVFEAKNIYRIDHYLGKEMLQNLIVLRFANSFFEPIWNHNYIDNIQISSCEKIGVGTRGGYYENSGALRDMVQNHLLQLLTLTTMEPPKSFGEQHIRDEKLKVLKNLTGKLDQMEFVRGQYGAGTMDKEPVIGYRQEDRVKKDSNIETFAAIRLLLNNERWQGVPIYIRTGKRLPQKVTEVVIEFKHPPQAKNFPGSEDIQPNLLVIKIQPEEGMEFHFNAKKPGTVSSIVPVKMDFCQNCQTGVNSPEAYERLLFDAMRGDATLFTSWEEIKYSWIFADKIEKLWEKQAFYFPNYKAGTWGPQKAMDLLEKDNRKWWNEGETR